MRLMNAEPQAQKSVIAQPRWHVVIAGWCAYSSAVVSVFGIGLLAMLYVTLIAFGDDFGSGRLNDISVIVHYALTLPIALVLRQLLKPYGPGRSLAGMLLGIVGMSAVIVLQMLLVTGVLTFRQQVGFVIVAFIPIAAWFVINGRLGRSSDILPGGMRLQVLAALYFGYPWWAFRLGRRLLSHPD